VVDLAGTTAAILNLVSLPGVMNFACHVETNLYRDFTISLPGLGSRRLRFI